MLRARPGSVAVRTAVTLALLAGAGVASERLAWWCAGLGAAALAWAVHDLRARTRFRLDRGAGRLELPHGKAIALDSIHDVSISGPHAEAPGVCEVMVNQGEHRWIPIYVGPSGWAHEVEQFIRRAKQTGPQQTAVPDRALALARSIEDARGQWGRAERIICMAMPRAAADEHVPDAASAAPAPAQHAHYASVLRALDRAERSGATPHPWRALAPGEIHAALTTAIGKELAYGHQYVPEHTAAGLADQFIALFTDQAHFFTVPADVRISRDASFDGGVMALDDHHAGILWFESDSPGR